MDLSADALLELIIGNKIGLGSGSSGSNLEELLSPRSSRLDILDYIPEEGTGQHQLDEPQITLEISDDVTALSALTKKPQGISSTYAALKAIQRIDAKAVGCSEQFSIFPPQERAGGRLFEVPCLATNIDLCLPFPSHKARKYPARNFLMHILLISIPLFLYLTKLHFEEPISHVTGQMLAGWGCSIRSSHWAV